MILAHEQDSFFFSSNSNGAGKNEFVSQLTCLQPHLHLKYNKYKMKI